MVEIEKELHKVLAELRNEEKRKFNQTLDLIVNLQKFDVKKDSVNLFVQVPHKVKDKKICAFLTTKHNDFDTITEADFKKYSGKKELKKLERSYDFFISQAILMPKVATVFGRVLGPSGKMPSPQLGIVQSAEDKSIPELKEKINHSIKIRSKEASLKLAIGKQDMKDEQLVDNIVAIYNSLLKNLPKGSENIKNIEIKFTMGKPQKIQLK
jgi:large subunit ribosomal protein L1